MNEWSKWRAKRMWGTHMRGWKGQYRVNTKPRCGCREPRQNLFFWLLRVMWQIYRKRLISTSAGASWRQVKRLLVVSMICDRKQGWLNPAEIHTCKVLRIKSRKTRHGKHSRTWTQERSSSKQTHLEFPSALLNKTIQLQLAADLSLILLVLSTASMSMRILYLTCAGTLVVQGYTSMKATPAQNLFSSSRCKAWRLIWDSSVYATNLSRSIHCEQQVRGRLSVACLADVSVMASVLMSKVSRLQRGSQRGLECSTSESKTKCH